MIPQRIQRKRTKGWKMPPNTVYVGRPSHFGNRFVVATKEHSPETLAHYADYAKNVDLWDGWPVCDAETAVAAFRKMQCGPTFRKLAQSALRGKDLACWCRLDQPCHADVLLEIANIPRVAPSK